MDNELGYPPHAFTLNTHLYMTSLRSLRPLLGPNMGVQTPIDGYLNREKAQNKFDNDELLTDND